MQMVWLIGITILGWVLLNRHRFGAHIYLIGDNVNSAELMGVNTGRTRIQAFMLIGLISAFAGMIASFYVAYFWPSLGDGFLLSTLASVFLGGTSVFGGIGTILGTFPRGLYHRLHRSRDGGSWPDGILDPVDLRPYHRAIRDHAYLSAQAWGVTEAPFLMHHPAWITISASYCSTSAGTESCEGRLFLKARCDRGA